MAPSDWRIHFAAEMAHARAARQAGNEGMARVCARRAAGIAVGEFYSRQGQITPGRSAYDRLKALAANPGLPEAVQQVAGHFLTRITPEHTLPVEADLIEEAGWLAEALLGETPNHRVE